MYIYVQNGVIFNNSKIYISPTIKKKRRKKKKKKNKQEKEINK